MWIAGFWFLPFAIGLVVVLVFISPVSDAPDVVLLVIAVAFVIAFVGLLVRGAVRRPR